MSTSDCFEFMVLYIGPRALDSKKLKWICSTDFFFMQTVSQTRGSGFISHS